MHELKNFEEPEPLHDPEDDVSPPPPGRLEPAGELLSDAEQGVVSSENVTPVEMTDVVHAERASKGAGLSFADLEARLAERARTSVDEDGGAGAEFTVDEKSDDD